MATIQLLADRRHLWAFTTGCLALTAGVLLHLPMFWMGRDNGFRLADMPMDAGMWWGMGLIVAGIVVAGYGLLPRKPVAGDAHRHVLVSAPEDAPLGSAHKQLMLVLTIALVIDVMKPASLGFVVPGMAAEYVVSKSMVAWLPFAALCGTVVGSVLWGLLADLYGRRASILLSAVMFVGTSICGAMPSFWWNVGMCFLMGAAAGGMLPVTYLPSGADDRAPADRSRRRGARQHPARAGLRKEAGLGSVAHRSRAARIEPARSGRDTGSPARGALEVKTQACVSAAVPGDLHAAFHVARDRGFQVAVAVVDRMGQPQVLLRDRFAGPHTIDMAIGKARTAASFSPRHQHAAEPQAGRPMSGIRALPRVIAAGGGVPIDEAGTLWGAIGVSGGPGGDSDDSCARAGIKAVADELAF